MLRQGLPAGSQAWSLLIWDIWEPWGGVSCGPWCIAHCLVGTYKIHMGMLLRVLAASAWAKGRSPSGMKWEEHKERGWLMHCFNWWTTNVWFQSTRKGGIHIASTLDCEAVFDRVSLITGTHLKLEVCEKWNTVILRMEKEKEKAKSV